MGDSIKGSFRAVWDSNQSDDDEDNEYASEQTVGEEESENSFEDRQPQSYVEDHNIDMCDALAEMYRNQSDFNNITISVKGPNEHDGVFSVHSLVLAMWSRYFSDEFYSESKKFQKYIQIDDMDPKVFEWVLSFMYNIYKPIETTRNALEIYKVAERFKIKHIMETMINHVCSQTPTVNEVLDILKATLYMNLNDKKEICLRFIEENTKIIFDESLDKFSVDVMKEVVKLDRLCFESEYEFVKYVFRWVKRHSKLNMMNTRDALEEFLPNLYFLCLSDEEFTKILQEYEDFFVGNEALSILMNIVIFRSKDLPCWLTVNE